MIPISILKEYTFFQDFNDEQLTKLTALATEESYPAGIQMYQKGDAAKGLYIVTQGKVILFMENYVGPHKPPMQVTVDIVTKGESMGWSAIVEPYIYTLNSLSIEDVKVIMFDAFGLRRLMDEDCALGYRMMRAVAKVISLRLTHTRIILVGERGLSVLTEY
jgi:CRP/FNR family transcriptional regulator, cyclic AMP receptor protein